jgi:hypothetical protein
VGDGASSSKKRTGIKQVTSTSESSAAGGTTLLQVNFKTIEEEFIQPNTNEALSQVKDSSNKVV